MSRNFMQAMEDTISRNQNVSSTENGAVGYRSTGKALLDLNFSASSLRSMETEEVNRMFKAAYEENPELALRWLFFLRDVREGMGERRSFRILLGWLERNDDDLLRELILAKVGDEPLIPYYGRWDDLLNLYYGHGSDVMLVIREQLEKDKANCRLGNPISLMAKWMPSINTSSQTSRVFARSIAQNLGMTERQYRKTMSMLRKYIDVVERKMSGNDWDEIKYDAVPARANLRYSNAFMRHDGERRVQFLNAVKNGNAKINAGTLYPYEIYNKAVTNSSSPDECNVLWDSLRKKYEDIQARILVVADGSGSMSWASVSDNCSALDVSNSLAIFFAELIQGTFHNKYITFSSNPQIVDLNNCSTFEMKALKASKYDDCSNTNIEATFDLILDTAIANHMDQDDMPETVMIISDMEFDDLRRKDSNISSRLFDNLVIRFEAAGYKMPRLVFWNVKSRTGTIPMIENDLGVALVSGFSANNVSMIMSGQLDPYMCLVDTLVTDRYDPVIAAVRDEY